MEEDEIKQYSSPHVGGIAKGSIVQIDGLSDIDKEAAREAAYAFAKENGGTRAVCDLHRRRLDAIQNGKEIPLV